MDPERISSIWTGVGTWMQADVEQTGHDDTHWRHGDTRNHGEHWRQVISAVVIDADECQVVLVNIQGRECVVIG
ncbi:hypothetical protein DPX16_15992 [Anabarilius grahami]|uniref:Uncharacterized protein n=1 Tax=Anabarilius grahami TaxID=495550 RepID=A0A3N0YTZ9_ANAGA|nr:hypothetical protein DPX16_15992 [Anabarilius grahami]